MTDDEIRRRIVKVMAPTYMQDRHASKMRMYGPEPDEQDERIRIFRWTCQRKGTIVKVSLHAVYGATDGTLVDAINCLPEAYWHNIRRQ